ncbi:hypothetical protein PG989_016135 [Apiospora arundinis]
MNRVQTMPQKLPTTVSMVDRPLNMLSTIIYMVHMDRPTDILLPAEFHGIPSVKLVDDGHCFTLRYSSIYRWQRLIVFRRWTFYGLGGRECNYQRRTIVYGHHVYFGDIFRICAYYHFNRKYLLGWSNRNTSAFSIRDE